MANYVRPLRDVNDHEVLNMFSFDGASADAGLFVKVKSGQGFRNGDDLNYETIGASYGNTVSWRWAVPARVQYASSGDKAVGMLLAEVRETDENSEQLIYRSRKATEMGVVRSGEAVPILMRGTVLLDSGAINGFPAGGEWAYINDNGKIGLTGVNHGDIGMFLGSHDSNGDVLVHVHCV